MKKYVLCLLGLSALSPSLLSAAEINLRGFGSIVGGTTLDSEDSVLEYNDHVNFQPDSLIALQMDAQLNEKLSATMQLVGKGANGYDPDIAWGYLTYDISDNLKVNAGRLRAPFYRYSDFLDVRYAYTWIKAPQTVYGLDTFSSVDGVSFLYNRSLGDWDSTLQLNFGAFDDVVNGNRFLIEDQFGLNWTMVRDWFTFRAGYFESHVSADLPQVNDLIALVQGIAQATSTDLSSIASGIALDSDPGNFMGVAIGIDRNNLVVDAEYIQYEVEDSITALTDAWYVLAGYRFGNLLPFVTYSKEQADPDLSLVSTIPGTAAGAPVPGTGGATFSQVIGGALAAGEVDTTLINVGVRYDFAPGAAFKVQIDQQEDIAGEKANLLRFGVDMVF